MTPAELKEARLRLGLTQTQMAERMGYTRKASICDMECGRMKITRRAALLVTALVKGERDE